MKALVLSGARGAGRVALVDDEDFPTIQRHRWFLASNGYVVANFREATGRRSLLLHRLLVGEDSPTVDHVNGDRLDNRRANLRRATSAENNANVGQRSHSRQPFKGVRARDGHWEARLASRSLGRFDSPERAAAAYDAAAAEAYGPFARPSGGTR